MDQKQLLDLLQSKFEKWERKTELNEQSMNEKLKKLFEVNSSKDQFLKEVIQGFQEIMKLQPDAQQKMLDRSMEIIDRGIENTNKMAEKVELWQKKYELQRKTHERILRNERRDYDRVIDIMVKKMSRLQGRDQMGSHLMRMVSQREDEIKQKYSNVLIDGKISNYVPHSLSVNGAQGLLN